MPADGGRPALMARAGTTVRDRNLEAGEWRRGRIVIGATLPDRKVPKAPPITNAQHP